MRNQMPRLYLLAVRDELADALTTAARAERLGSGETAEA